jgi:hypothetical protein
MSHRIMPAPTFPSHCEISAHIKEFNLRTLLILIALAITLYLFGCSSKQLYNAGQAWQRNHCSKITDAQERNRCMENTNTSYEAYKRQTEEVKSAK